MSSPYYLLINAVGLSVSISFLWKIARRTGDWLTYAHLFSVMWAANLIISQVVMDRLLRPDIRTLTVLYAAWWAFLAGGLLVIRKPLVRRQLPVRVNRVSALIVLGTLVGLQLAAYLYEMVSLGIDPISLVRNFFTIGSDLRLSNVYASINYPLFLSLWRWNHVLYVPLALFLHHKKVLSTKVLASLFVLAFVLSWVKFTRAPFIQLVLISFISWIVIYRPQVKTRYVVGLALAALVLVGFVITQRTLSRRTDPYAKSAPSENLFAYIGASPKAYETLIDGYFPKADTGYYSLESVNFILYKLSIIDSYPGLDRPYAAMPYQTNVYTFLDAFTLDWGIYVAIFCSLVIGVAVAWIYKRMWLAPSYANVTIYCNLAYCCIMAIANNEFIRVSVILNMFLAVVIGLMVFARRRTPSKAVCRPMGFDVGR